MQLTSAQLTGALRWVGTMIAGYLVQHAIVNSDATAGIVALVVGGGTFVWSQIQKMQTKSALAKAQASSNTTAAVPAVPK